MKNFKNIFTLILVMTLFFTSCNSDDDNSGYEEPIIETPQPDGEALQQNFLDNRGESIQTGTIEAETGGSIYGEQGTELVFEPNAFLDGNGDPVTGDVTIELIESYKKSDMLLMNMPTIGRRSNGDIETLISGGEFFVNATKNGENLQLDGSFRLLAPSLNDEFDVDMKLFNGIDDDCNDGEKCVGPDGNIVWEEDEQNGLEPAEVMGPAGQYVWGYSTYVAQFGWTNIDKWFNDPRPKTTVYVDVPEGYNKDNCAVYLSYDGEPTALASMDMWDPELEMFTEHYGLIPIGLEVHFIFISQVDDEWNYAIHSATIEEDHVECFCDPLEIESITEEELTTLINDLP